MSGINYRLIKKSTRLYLRFFGYTKRARPTFVFQHNLFMIDIPILIHIIIYAL